MADRKTLLLGLLLGNLAGLLLLCGGLPYFRRFLEAAFPYSASGYYVGDFVVFLSLILGALVFPAVLTTLANRLYTLWGLLPIFLLMLWLTAGCMSVHRLSSLMDPPWALPVSVAACWGIASLPISLFRFLRRRQKRSAAPASNPASVMPTLSLTWRQVYLFAPLTLLLSVGILGWHNLNYPMHSSVVMQPHWLSGKEAIIPLVEHGNGLYVNAWLNNQEVLCKVDTGAESVEWSRGLHIVGKLSSIHGQTCDLLGGCVATQTVVLPQVKIGDFVITNLPTEMSEASSGPFTPLLEEGAEQPLLGNTAFVRTVLTIDYKYALLTIWPPQHDFSLQPLKPGDRILEMGWSTHYSDKDWRRSFYGTPAVQTSLGGAPFWCTLDTGADGPEICLTKTLVDRNSFVKQKRHDVSSMHAASSSAQVERVDDLSVEFPCLMPRHTHPITLKLNGLITPTLKNDDPMGGGVIGIPLMKHYRITIDYGRGRILLEPYVHQASEQKQEKPRSVAKKLAI